MARSDINLWPAHARWRRHSVPNALNAGRRYCSVSCRRTEMVRRQRDDAGSAVTPTHSRGRRQPTGGGLRDAFTAGITSVAQLPDCMMAPPSPPEQHRRWRRTSLRFADPDPSERARPAGHNGCGQAPSTARPWTTSGTSALPAGPPPACAPTKAAETIDLLDDPANAAWAAARTWALPTTRLQPARPRRHRPRHRCHRAGRPAAHQDIVGTPGQDFLKGTAGDDVIRGLASADILWGQGGDDRLFGGNGKDTLVGKGRHRPAHRRAGCRPVRVRAAAEASADGPSLRGDGRDFTGARATGWTCAPSTPTTRCAATSRSGPSATIRSPRPPAQRPGPRRRLPGQRQHGRRCRRRVRLRGAHGLPGSRRPTSFIMSAALQPSGPCHARSNGATVVRASRPGRHPVQRRGTPCRGTQRTGRAVDGPDDPDRDAATARLRRLRPRDPASSWRAGRARLRPAPP